MRKKLAWKEKWRTSSGGTSTGACTESQTVGAIPLHILESEESALVVVPHCHRGMREVKCHPPDTVHFLLLLQLQREMLFKLPESWKLHDNGLLSISGKVFWVRIIKPWEPPKVSPVNLFQNRSKIRDRRQTKTGSRQSVKPNLSTSEPRSAESINEICILKLTNYCAWFISQNRKINTLK